MFVYEYLNEINKVENFKLGERKEPKKPEKEIEKMKKEDTKINLNRYVCHLQFFCLSFLEIRANAKGMYQYYQNHYHRKYQITINHQNHFTKRKRPTKART